MKYKRKFIKAKNWIVKKVTDFLTAERFKLNGHPLCDFNKLNEEVRAGDVILIEGRSRLSNVIKTITLSRWTHSALYIGKLKDIKDKEMRAMARVHCKHCEEGPFIIEALFGYGVILSPLSIYKDHNIRICRPKYISPHDAWQVIYYSITNLGKLYHTRHIIDIGRFFLPYSLLPKRYRSTLFEHKISESSKTICSTMLAEAFARVQYPILPMLKKDENGNLKWFKRNSRLFVPSDFDISPYFDIIKYPFLGDDVTLYKNLPWDKENVVFDDEKIVSMKEFIEEEIMDSAIGEGEETNENIDRQTIN